MRYLSLFGSYVGWHYGRAFIEAFSIWINLFRFTINFFSTKIILKTLFSPIMRLSEDKPRGFDPSGFAASILVNTLMRITGFFMRMIFLFIATLFILINFLLGIVIFILWFFAPVILIILIATGVYFLI